MVADSIHIILVLSLVGFITNTIAWKRGFYEWHPCSSIPPIAFRHVLTLFAIYIGVTYILAGYVGALLQKFSNGTPELPIFSSFALIFFMIACFYIYCRTQAKGIFPPIWKNPTQVVPTSLFFDFGLGVITWFIAFPIVQVVGQILDLFLYLIFRLESYEQIAVRYLKTTLQSPFLTMIALISIVIVAPILEEFLFRGALQTYLKRKFQTKTAILVSALCFSLFHFSLEQGFGNLSLIPSLFVFACFLGYIYERQGSLYASIGLHMAFNFVSSVRILISPG